VEKMTDEQKKPFNDDAKTKNNLHEKPFDGDEPKKKPHNDTKSNHGMLSSAASLVKKRGHEIEKIFNEKFGDSKAVINYSGKTSDCVVTKLVYQKHLIKLNPENYTISIKSGKTMQFHLGNIPELSNKETFISSYHKNLKGHSCGKHNVDFEAQVKHLKSIQFWQKYLKKGAILCYVEDCKYVFFKMDDIIDLIILKFTWRLLSTGRIKGDFNGKMGIITFEYRKDHNSFVLGAHGGRNGILFVKIISKILQFDQYFS
jgi:hypothetical protein